MWHCRVGCVLCSQNIILWCFVRQLLYMLKGMCGNFLMPETPQLCTHFYLKCWLSIVIGQATLTLLHSLYLSWKPVLVWFYNQCSFTLEGITLFTICVVWVYHYLLWAISICRLCACL